MTKMDTRGKLIGIGLSLAALVGLALWLGSRDRPETIVVTQLLPEFASQRESAERVSLFTSAGEPAVELRRSGDAWTVTQRDGFPADVGKVGVLLDSLAELRVIEPKTAAPENHPALGVEDVSQADAQGLRVVVAAGTDLPLADLIVGKQAAGIEATYVRKSGEAQSWMVNRLEVSRLPGAWIEPLVTHIDTDRIQQATFRVTGSPVITASKSGRVGGNFVVTGLPRGQQLATPASANGIAAALIAIQANDVRRVESLANVAPAARAEYRMFDGLVFEVTGWTVEDQNWIALQPSFDASLAARFADEKPPEGTNTAFWRTPEQAQQEVARLATKLTGWAFRIPQHRYEDVFPDPAKWVTGGGPTGF